MRSKIRKKVNARLIKPSVQPSSSVHRVIRKNILERYPSTSNFIGVFVGAALTLVALLFTVRFSKESFDFSKLQYDEAKIGKTKSDSIARQEKIKAGKKEKQREARSIALDSLRNQQTEKQLMLFEKQAAIAQNQLINQKGINRQTLLDNSPLLIPASYFVTLDTAIKLYNLSMPIVNSGKRVAFNCSVKFFVFDKDKGKANTIPSDENEQDLVPSASFGSGFNMSPDIYKSSKYIFAIRIKYVDPPISSNSANKWIYFKLSPKFPNQGATVDPPDIDSFKAAIAVIKQL